MKLFGFKDSTLDQKGFIFLEQFWLILITTINFVYRLFYINPAIIE
jgi:hypothetical protein